MAKTGHGINCYSRHLCPVVPSSERGESEEERINEKSTATRNDNETSMKELPKNVSIAKSKSEKTQIEEQENFMADHSSEVNVGARHHSEIVNEPGQEYEETHPESTEVNRENSSTEIIGQLDDSKIKRNDSETQSSLREKPSDKYTDNEGLTNDFKALSASNELSDRTSPSFERCNPSNNVEQKMKTLTTDGDENSTSHLTQTEPDSIEKIDTNKVSEIVARDCEMSLASDTNIPVMPIGNDTENTPSAPGTEAILFNEKSDVNIASNLVDSLHDELPTKNNMGPSIATNNSNFSLVREIYNNDCMRRSFAKGSIPEDLFTNEICEPNQNTIMHNNVQCKVACNEAEPKKKSEGKLLRSYFETDFYLWLWYKRARPGEHEKRIRKYECQVREESSEDYNKIKLNFFPTNTEFNMDMVDACIKKIEKRLKDIQGHCTITEKSFNLTYTSEMERITCPLGTYICDDMNEGVVIIGNQEKDVQSVYDMLEVEYGIGNEDNSNSTHRKKRVRKLMEVPSSRCDTETAIEATYETSHGQKIHVFKGDITILSVDAVVNAANRHLRHGGGVARAISNAAGPKLQAECSSFVQLHGPLPTSGVYVSRAYNMPCEYVIHVVGPRWSDYKDKTKAEDYLRHCFRTVLAEADRLNLPSIAIPAIGSGIYGSPLPLVAQLMFDGVKNFTSGSLGQSAVQDIVLVDVNTEILQLLNIHFQQAVGQGYVKKGPVECDRFTNGSTDKRDMIKIKIGKEARESPRKTNEMQVISAGQTAPETQEIIKETTSFTDKGFVMPDRNQPFQDGDTLPNESIWTPALGYTPGLDTSSSSSNQALPCLEADTSPLNPFSTPEVLADPAAAEKIEDCAICMEIPTEKVVLPICKHVFCKNCIDTWFKNKPTCPNCGQIHGEMKGDQPEGSMTVNHLLHNLNGVYNSSGTLEINYNFPGGTQQACHPNPGSWYNGTRRTAYLPDNEEGNHVLALLRRAFDAKLIFTIGRSTTTGRDDQITWNDIHHKTSMSGGPARFGYPDETYLSRVQEELAAKGIK